MSTTATRFTDVTRKAIVEAASELLFERRGGGFSVQEVADRTGLTHRTVYRYFSTRQALITAAAQHLGPGLVDDRFEGVTTVEEWIAAVKPHFDQTEAHFDVIRSVVVAILASDDFDRLRGGISQRDSHRWDVFRRQFPHLPEREARNTFATLRHLLSSISYVLYRMRFGLTPV